MSLIHVHNRPLIVTPKTNNRKITESYYQKILENVLNGKHKRIPSGITDVTTEKIHAEIKCWPKWRHAIGQLMSYNVYEYRPDLRIYLFDSYCKKQKQVALNVFHHYSIMPFEFQHDDFNLRIIDLTNNKCVYKNQE